MSFKSALWVILQGKTFVSQRISLTYIESNSLKQVSMYITKCPVCGSSHTIKNGKRKGVQMYACRACGSQFRNSKTISKDEIWESYLRNKQTVSQLSVLLGVSPSTIKRRLHEIVKEWTQPSLSGGGFVHLDATYWGRNWGVIAALDYASGKPLYLEFIQHEKVIDYKNAVDSIEARGYEIKGIIIDGMPHLFAELKKYNIQMCQFHMKQIIKRYLTLNPRLHASRELKAIMEELTGKDKDTFTNEFNTWKEKWNDTLSKRSLLKSGKTQYTHKRLRSAMHSIEFYLPYLFTYQEEECKGMPNTNNKIEGTFTSLKNSIRNHSGMAEENRKRFIIGFFLALNETLSMKKQESD